MFIFFNLIEMKVITENVGNSENWKKTVVFPPNPLPPYLPNVTTDIKAHVLPLLSPARVCITQW